MSRRAVYSAGRKMPRPTPVDVPTPGALLQSVHFSRRLWTQAAARRWLAENGDVPIKPVHVTPSQLQYRIRPPNPRARYVSYADDYPNVGIRLVGMLL